MLQIPQNISQQICRAPECLPSTPFLKTHEPQGEFSQGTVSFRQGGWYLVVQEVAPVGVGLHEAPLEQLPQGQLQQQGAHRVPYGLSHLGHLQANNARLRKYALGHTPRGVGWFLGVGLFWEGGGSQLLHCYGVGGIAVYPSTLCLPLNPSPTFEPWSHLIGGGGGGVVKVVGPPAFGDHTLKILFSS